MKKSKSMIILGVLALIIMSFSGVYASDLNLDADTDVDLEAILDANLNADFDDGFKMNMYYNGKEAWCTYNGSTKAFWTGYIGEQGASGWMDCGPVYCYYAEVPGKAYMACNTRPEYNDYLKTGSCKYDPVPNLVSCSMEY